MSQQESSHFAVAAQAYYPGQAYNTPAMLQLAALINADQGRLLDIGCGDGQLLKLLKERFPDIEMAGLTVSEEERRVCGDRFDVRVGDMHSLPWQEAEFDVVISRHSLEHSISPLTALFEVNRVLRLDGVFHVVVPAPVSEWVIKMKDHFSVLPRPMWEKLFDDAGFAVEQYQEGAWLASYSMQSEAEMRFILRKVRDVRLRRESSQRAEAMPGVTTPVASVPTLSTLVERRIVVVLHNLVLFDAIRPVVERFSQDVKFLVPITGDEGFDAMGERTYDSIIAAGFKVERTALPADIRCDIELSPYPYSGRNVTQAKWRVRFMYGLAKEAWNFSLENNVYYDFVLAYGEYDARVLSAYSTPVRVGNPKIQSVRRPSVLNERPVLLYLPTYGPTSSIEAVSRIQSQLKSRFRVIAKAHHGTTYLEPERTELLQAWVDELAHHDTNLSSLLASANVVLTDGSGAIFDAIAAEVPVAVFQETVLGGLNGTASLEERIVRDGPIFATKVAEDIPATLERALQAGPQPLAALRHELFAALGDEAAERAAGFLSELLAGAATYETFAVARRTLQAKIADGAVQRQARQAAERQLEDAYRSLTDRLLVDVQASLARVTERDGQLASLNQAVTERDGQLASLNQAVTERDGQLASLNQAVTERDGQLASLNQAVTERDGQLASLNQAVTERDGQLASLNQAVTERDGQLASLNQAVTERDGQLASLNQAVTERDGQLANLRIELSGLTMMNRVMRDSISWRITAPLRFFMRLKRHGFLPDDRRWFESKLRLIFRKLPMGIGVKTTIRKCYVRFFGLPLSDSSAQPIFLKISEAGTRHQHQPDLAENNEGKFLAPERWEHRKRPYGVLVLPIIDWHFRFQRPQQIARRFARNGHSVAYVSLGFGPEMAVAHIEDGIEGLRLPGSEDTNVYQDTPTEAVAEQLTEALISYVSEFAPHRPWVCIVQLPYWGKIAERLRQRLGYHIIYDCMDDHAGFTTNGEQMLAAEDHLLHQADLVVASSALLFDKASPVAKRTALIRNAVDYAHFATVRPTVHSQVSNLVVGYYGAIADWFDSALVADVACLRPSWQFVLIGSTFSAETGPLTAQANIGLKGEKPYQELPSLITGWDCCIIPFKRLPLTEATNPVKVYEMLAAGKPVVSVSLPELLPIAEAGHIALADTAAEFVREIEQQVVQDNAALQNGRRRYAAENTWEVRQSSLNDAICQLYPLVSIVVVTYNNLALNRLCLESLVNDTDYPNYEVIVVDNASSDDTPEYLKSLDYPNLTVILNEENLGFSAANNQGLARARGAFLCLLNNDTVVTGSWLSTLVRHLQANPSFGLVGPVTNAIGNEAKIPVGYHNLLDMPDWVASYCQSKSGCVDDIPMLAFFCVVMPRTVYETVGPLDVRFGIGMFEDDDYNRRVREAGYEVKLARDAYIHHWQRASFKLLGEEAYLETYYDNEKKYRSKWANSSLNKLEVEQLAGLVAASKASHRTIIFAPSVGWNIHLFQRPHHLARVFAQDGCTVVFDCSNSNDDVQLLKEIEPRLFLFHGETGLLANLNNPVVWTFTYNYEYRDGFPQDTPVVYDWIDDLEVFPYDQQWLAELHARAMKEASVVACVARRLLDKAIVERPETLYLPNAVEEGRFDHPPTPNPALADKDFIRIVKSGKLIAGYYGALARWFDYDLLGQTAQLCPDWHFVLIGPDHDGSIGESGIKNHRNITWLGPRDYQSLPGYLHHFEVATIPFKINDITIATSPLKLFEYFAGGRPVVSTPMPECSAFEEVIIAANAEEFASALVAARTSATSSDYKNRLARLAEDNTWRSRARLVLKALEDKADTNVHKFDGTAPLAKADQDSNLPIPDVFQDWKNLHGYCNICGLETRFFYQEPALYREQLTCEHCRSTSRYRSIASGLLQAIKEITGIECDALAHLPHTGVARRIGIYDTQPPFRYEPCAYPIADYLLRCDWIELQLSAFKPGLALGSLIVEGVTNQNLENLTFPDESFDIVITSDVMEHVRNDMAAHAEIARVLRQDGIYLFTVSHNWEWNRNLIRVNINDPERPELDEYLLEPEYHGDANSSDGSGVLSYRSYGRELERQLATCGLRLQYEKSDRSDSGILNTEIFYCRSQKVASESSISNELLSIQWSEIDMLKNSLNRNFFCALKDRLASIVNDPCYAMYFRFALSANERGRAVAQLLASRIEMEGKRHLDVGCAYGGFMVAFSEHGMETCGFDIDPQLLKLAQQNFTDFGRSFPTYLKDVTKQAEIEEYSGCFDIITCNDVIEHVSDVALTFKHISQMLTQDGVVFFEIPNRDAAPFVISDGHYQLFGITQLDHADAAEYFIANSPSTPYGVEHYYRLHEYRELLEEAGLFMEILPETLLDVDIQTIQLTLGQLEQSLDEKLAGVPESVRSKVHDALLIYLKTAKNASISTVDETHNFKLKYGASFWKMLAWKKFPVGTAELYN